MTDFRFELALFDEVPLAPPDVLAAELLGRLMEVLDQTALLYKWICS